MFKIDTDYFFLKIGTRHFMEKLFYQGEIFCNSFEYFAKHEKKEVGDRYETVSDLHLGRLKRIGFNDKSGVKQYFKVDVPAQLKEFHTGHVGNLFCLYAFKYSDYLDSGEVRLPEAISGFGDSIVMIVDIHQFLERVRLKLTELNKTYTKNFVKYLELSCYSGKRDPFQKDTAFSHQNEYRLYLHPNVGENKGPFCFSIGDISDIAQLCDLENFKIELQYEG